MEFPAVLRVFLTLVSSNDLMILGDQYSAQERWHLYLQDSKNIVVVTQVNTGMYRSEGTPHATTIGDEIITYYIF